MLAAAHRFYNLTADAPTIILLVVAAIPWLYPLFKSIELLGVKFELQELQEKVQEAHKTIQLIEENARLPGKKDDGTGTFQGAPTARGPSRRGSQPFAPELTAVAPKPADNVIDDEEDSWSFDPNSGKFGGSPASNGRVLEAVVTPASNSRSAACKVHLRVRSTDPKRPLTGKVKLFLHPTFGRWSKYDVEVKNGVAQDTITSWGAFTVGAIADRGETKLELDLQTVPGGTSKFYSQ